MTGHAAIPAALRHPTFVRLWAGSMVSSVGTQMNNVAKLWLLYLLTHSAMALAVDGLCFSVPIALLPLLAGPIVDRVGHLTILKAAMTVEAVEAGALAAAAATGTVRPWMIYLAATVDAGRLAFDIPARAALTTSLVPAPALLSAQSLSAAVWNSSALIGPALAGVLLTATNAATVFAVNGASTVVALAAILPLRPDPAGGHDTEARWTAGLRFAARHRDLLGLLGALLATSTLILGAETLLPVLDQTLWHGGSLGYGLLRMAPGVAAVTAGAAQSVLPPPRRPGRAITLGVTTACLGLIVFPQMPMLAGALGCLALASLALTTTQIQIVTRTQQLTPAHLRGAIGGYGAITQSGLAGIAAAGMTAVAASLGAGNTIILAAAVTALGATAFAIASRCPGGRDQ
jgi:MFS family permease